MSPRRLDVIPRGRAALRVLGGDALGDAADPALQRLVEAAAADLAMPIALVSLVLDRVQLFRAQHGLPPDLAAVRATDRDASFCQLVVRDEAMLEVTDASCDDRVPTELVERYGIAAYLGAPLRVGGEVVGSLCVLDTAPRAFDAAARDRLLALAAEVGARLDELAREDRALTPGAPRGGEEHGGESALHQRAIRPAFAEIRNLLTPMLGGFGGMRIAAAELAVAHRLLVDVIAHGPRASADALSGVAGALEDLRASLADAEASTRELADAAHALELASLDAPHPALGEVLRAASTIAHHHTKLVGGVRWTAIDEAAVVEAPRSLAVSVVAAALAGAADHLYRDLPRPAARPPAPAPRDALVACAARRADQIVVTLEAPGRGTAWITALEGSLGPLLEASRGVAVRATSRSLDVVLALAA